jgi:hypothetical protein
MHCQHLDAIHVNKSITGLQRMPSQNSLVISFLSGQESGASYQITGHTK